MPRADHQCLPLLSAVLAAMLSVAPTAMAQETAAPATDEYGQQVMTQQQINCLTLSRQLAKDWQQGGSPRDQIPRIEAQIARVDASVRHSEGLAEQADCFDYFLFSKSWRNTAQCNKLRAQIDDGQRQLAELDRQRQMAASSQDHNSRQDALLAELARNKCGQQYEAAARQRSSDQSFGLWNDAESVAPGAGIPGMENMPPGSTFRTICVRMCDGYYFPISFATTRETFDHDAQTCQSQCASPAKLYYYQNPGAEVQQAVALDGTAYTELRNAFRYRKELVTGCSCKATASAIPASLEQGGATTAAPLGAQPDAAVDSGDATQGFAPDVQPSPDAAAMPDVPVGQAAEVPQGAPAPDAPGALPSVDLPLDPFTDPAPQPPSKPAKVKIAPAVSNSKK